MLLVLLSPRAPAGALEEVQRAAGEGRLAEVVDLLTIGIETTGPDPVERAQLLSNRGVARSLLGEFDKAKQDFESAIELDANNVLSLALRKLCQRCRRCLKRLTRGHRNTGVFRLVSVFMNGDSPTSWGTDVRWCGMSSRQLAGPLLMRARLPEPI